MKTSLWSRARHSFDPGPKNYFVTHPREAFTWKKFWRHYFTVKTIAWLLIFIALVLVMEFTGLLKGFETAGLDTFLRLNRREMSEHIVIVEITEKDYNDDNLFQGQSPLDSKKLANLVSSVQNYEPAVIAMDFDTESKNWCQLDSSDLAKLLPEKGASVGSLTRSPVVWAEVPSNTEEPLRLTPVLGGMLGNSQYVGIPRFPVDADGLVRRYASKFSVVGALGDCSSKEISSHIPDGEQHLARPKEGDILLSFARAAIKYACYKIDCSKVDQTREHPVIFNFYGDRYRFPIIQSHEFIGPEAEPFGANKELDARRKALLGNKIVLIGGNFNAARDVYLTPLGPMAGVELIALAIESDFGGGIRETHVALGILADFVVGSLIVLIYFYYRLRPRFALLISLVGVPLVGIIFSSMLFHSAAYWFNFMPIIIGMVMHQMLELSESCGELQEKIHKLEHRIDMAEASTLVESTGVLRDATPPQEEAEARTGAPHKPKP